MKLLFFNAYTSFKHMKLKHLLNMMYLNIRRYNAERKLV